MNFSQLLNYLRDGMLSALEVRQSVLHGDNLEDDSSVEQRRQYHCGARFSWIKTLHPVCRGCKFYVGHPAPLQNNDPFICAIHPYGPDDDRCPDWEQDKPFVLPTTPTRND